MTKPTPTDTPNLSGKLYFTIGEVSEMTGVKAYVLRYWESEFPSLKPKKGRGGSRRYRRSDIEQLLQIRELLYEQGFRIAGARKHLAELRKSGKPAPAAPQLTLGFADLDHSDQIAQLKSELLEIREQLQKLERPVKKKKRAAKA